MKLRSGIPKGHEAYEPVTMKTSKLSAEELGKGWGRRRLNGVCERVGVIGINTVFTQIGAEPQRGRKVREQRSEKRVRGE